MGGGNSLMPFAGTGGDPIGRDPWQLSPTAGISRDPVMPRSNPFRLSHTAGVSNDPAQNPWQLAGAITQNDPMMLRRRPPFPIVHSGGLRSFYQ